MFKLYVRPPPNSRYMVISHNLSGQDCIVIIVTQYSHYYFPGGSFPGFFLFVYPAVRQVPEGTPACHSDQPKGYRAYIMIVAGFATLLLLIFAVNWRYFRDWVAVFLFKAVLDDTQGWALILR